MELEEFKLQFKRLKRHYKSALDEKDPVSFLDLSHSLRIWCDNKKEVESYLSENQINIFFEHVRHNKKVKHLGKGGNSIYMPLSDGVDSSEIQVKEFSFINRALTESEIKVMEQGMKESLQPRDSLPKSNLSYIQWLGASVIYTNENITGVDSPFSISRETIMKRASNILGGSHPKGSEFLQEKAQENFWDSQVRKVHDFTLANGYPATYYQLLEIAKIIIVKFEPVFGEPQSA